MDLDTPCRCKHEAGWHTTSGVAALGLDSCNQPGCSCIGFTAAPTGLLGRAQLAAQRAALRVFRGVW